MNECWSVAQDSLESMSGEGEEREGRGQGRVTTNTRHMVDMVQGLKIKPLTSPTGLHVLSLRALPPLLGIRY